MKNKVEYFTSHQPFYEYINKFLPLLEVNNSVPRSRYTFIYDGVQYPHNNLFSMLGKLNTLIGKDLFLLKGSRSIGRLRYGICIDCDVEDSLLSEPSVVTSKKEVESLDVVVSKGDEVTSEGVTDPVMEGVITQEVDWDWVNSLEDSPENRLALDEYAEKFSVKLRRSMKTTNMAKDFRKKL